MITIILTPAFVAATILIAVATPLLVIILLLHEHTKGEDINQEDTWW